MILDAFSTHLSASSGGADPAEFPRSLRLKYERMLTLASETAAGTIADPRPAMAALSVDYPGSLRELDGLPLHVIEARIAALTEAESDASKLERWMVAQALFHRFARAALTTKRWLAGRKVVTADVREDFTRELHDSEAWLMVEELEAIAAPPRGRITDVVHARVARSLSVTSAEARALVFTTDSTNEGR